jgi:hypothetical protein
MDFQQDKDITDVEEPSSMTIHLLDGDIHTFHMDLKGHMIRQVRLDIRNIKLDKF